MPHIKARPRKDGGTTYTIEIRKAGSKPRYVSYDNYFDAEKFVKDLEGSLSDEVLASRPHDRDASLRKFLEEPVFHAIERFKRSDDCKPRHENILPIIERHIADTLKFGQIRKTWVKRFIKKMRSTNSPRRGIPYADPSIASMVQTLNVIAKWQADEFDIPHQDLRLTVDGIEGEWTKERRRRLWPDEERRLMQRLRKIDRPNRYHWRLLVRLALETGARQQEMVKAEWKEVDVDRAL